MSPRWFGVKVEEGRAAQKAVMLTLTALKVGVGVKG